MVPSPQSMLPFPVSPWMSAVTGEPTFTGLGDSCMDRGTWLTTTDALALGMVVPPAWRRMR